MCALFPRQVTILASINSTTDTSYNLDSRWSKISPPRPRIRPQSYLKPPKAPASAMRPFGPTFLRLPHYPHPSGKSTQGLGLVQWFSWLTFSLQYNSCHGRHFGLHFSPSTVLATPSATISKGPALWSTALGVRSIVQSQTVPDFQLTSKKDSTTNTRPYKSRISIKARPSNSKAYLGTPTLLV